MTSIKKAAKAIDAIRYFISVYYHRDFVSDTPFPPTPILFTTAASWSFKLIYRVSYFRRRQWSLTEDSEEVSYDSLRIPSHSNPAISRFQLPPLRRLCVFTRGAPHSVSISYHVSFSTRQDHDLPRRPLFFFHRRRMV